MPDTSLLIMAWNIGPVGEITVRDQQDNSQFVSYPLKERTRKTEKSRNLSTRRKLFPNAHVVAHIGVGISLDTSSSHKTHV